MGSTFSLFGETETEFALSKNQIESFHRDGFLRIDDVAPVSEIEKLLASFERLKEKEGTLGRDMSDINAEYGKPKAKTAGISIMVPREYDGDLKDMLLEKRCAKIAEQLFGKDMIFAFDRFIAKKPHRTDAVFHWHQDSEYCDAHGDNPQLRDVKDERVAVFSIALDNTTAENGCIRYVRGSHKEALRNHQTIHDNVKNQKNLLFDVTTAKVDEDAEDVVEVPVKRCGLTIHGNKILHASAGNDSSNWRRTYQMQFRSKEYIGMRDSLGITRSFNK